MPITPEDDQMQMALPQGEFWELEFANSYEWGFLLGKLFDKVLKRQANNAPIPADKAFVTVEQAADGPRYVYHLSKTLFQADDVAHMTGVAKEQLVLVKRLRLKNFKQPEGIPSPNVPYHGEA